MSTREEGAPSPRVETRDDLVRWIAAGEKPKPQWRIGTEHEKFPFLTDTLEPVPYEGARSIRALLEGLRDRFLFRAELSNATGALQQNIIND